MIPSSGDLARKEAKKGETTVSIDSRSDTSPGRSSVKELALERKLGWVATSKAHQRSGLAELVIRTSLEDAAKATGLERTSLGATNEGLPVYRRMGYRPVVKFPFCGPERNRA
jgi:hypothetical protein